jgi:membrane-bound lytic murein transglycosylase B
MIRLLKPLLLCLALCALCLADPAYAHQQVVREAAIKPFDQQELSILIHDLAMKGWSPADLHALFTDPDIFKIDELVKVNVTAPITLRHEKYRHFLSQASVEKARRFKNKWRTTFRRAARKHGVDPEVILGILLVETQFGRIKGNYPVVAVFGSIYVDTSRMLQDPRQRRTFSSAMVERIQRKRAWAFAELEALLLIKKAHPEVKLASLKGSYAGAFGMCQFLPSSYQRWAVSAHGKRAADLNWPPDAIYSVANYLRKNGYRKNRPLHARKRAIWHYNNSDVYVDTVLAVKDALQNPKALATR